MNTFLFNNNLIKYEKIIKILILLIFFVNSLTFKNSRNKNVANKNKIYIKNKNISTFSQRKYYLFEFISNYRDKNIFFNITYFNYTYSFKYNILKIFYYIGFFDKNNYIISPSDLTLYYNLQIFCHVFKLNNNTNIGSIASIYNNKYYKCIEFLNINDTFNIGIIVNNKVFGKSYYAYLFHDKVITYNKLNINDLEFVPLIINKTNEHFIKNKINYNEESKLTGLYILEPIFLSKEKAITKSNDWVFLNIYNYYYCSCKGLKCLYNNVTKLCKFNFYLNIIDNNKNIYEKTDYLLADFIYASYSSDDVYPIFEEMIKSNLPAHYLTEKIDI